MPGNPKDSPSIKDRASEVSEVLEYGHGILQFQDLLFLVFEKRQGKAENDLWGGQGLLQRSTRLLGRTGLPGWGSQPRGPRHVPTGTGRATTRTSSWASSIEGPSPIQLTLRQAGTQNQNHFW